MIFHCTDWLIGILLRLNMAWLVTIPKELGRKFHSPIFQLPIATISPTAHTTTAKVVTSRCRDIIAEGVSERRPGKALRNQRVPSGDWLTPGLWDIRPSDFFKTRDGLWLFTHMGFLIISHKIIIEEKKCIKKQTILSMLHVFPTRPFKKVIIVTCNQMSFHPTNSISKHNPKSKLKLPGSSHSSMVFRKENAWKISNIFNNFLNHFSGHFDSMWGFERVYDMNNVAGSSSNPRDPGSPKVR